MVPFLPSRDFKVIIDPELLNQFWTNPNLGSVINTIHDLKLLENPVTVKLFTPSKERISTSFDGIVEMHIVKQDKFVPSKWLKKDNPSDFKKIENLDKQASVLLSSSFELKADCIITSNNCIV